MLQVARELQLDEPELWAERLERTSLGDITEYGRAVHAEMDALITCARIGASARDGTLYVTTYPCHNCARHIIAAGLSRVVFIEPYPKSRALELHGDELDEVEPGCLGNGDKVCFEPFVGVGPRRFFDFFSMKLGDGYLLRRKSNDGVVLGWARASATPRLKQSEEAFLEVEGSLAGDLLPFLRDTLER